MHTIRNHTINERQHAGELIRTISISLAYAVVIAISARISFLTPISPVPVTLQTAAVILGGLLLGSKRGVLSVGFYIIAGILGAPVFAMGVAGPAIFVQPSFGYILGFIPAAWLAGLIAERCNSSFGWNLVASITAMIAIYLTGFSWLTGYNLILSGQVTESFRLAYIYGVSPFVYVDSVKILLVAGAAFTAGKRLIQNGK